MKSTFRSFLFFSSLVLLTISCKKAALINQILQIQLLQNINLLHRTLVFHYLQFTLIKMRFQLLSLLLHRVGKQHSHQQIYLFLLIYLLEILMLEGLKQFKQLQQKSLLMMQLYKSLQKFQTWQIVQIIKYNSL